MAHAIQIRNRAVELLKEGYTQEFISKILSVSITSIKRWKKRYEEHDRLNVLYDTTSRNAPKLPAKEVEEYFKSNNDALLKEAAEHFGCTPQAVFYACSRNKITYKKKRLSTKSAMKKNVINSQKQ
jgi:transposase